MKVIILNEHGYDEALYGIGLSFGLTSDVSEIDFMRQKDDETRKLKERLAAVALKICAKEGGENKFLRQVSVWMSIDAAWYWWKQHDTYKIGTTAQSESSMHTIMHSPFTQDMFEETPDDERCRSILLQQIAVLNSLRERYLLTSDENEKKKVMQFLIAILPSSFMQKRVVSLNYAVLRNMLKMRHSHRLQDWRIFCDAVFSQIEHPEFLKDCLGSNG